MIKPALRRIILVIRRYKPKEFFLGMMPKGSVCAEIGVWKGDFSDKILQETKPKKLHLIDPWMFFPDETYKNAVYGGISGSQKTMDEAYDSVIKRFSGDIKSGKVAIHRKTSEDAAREFRDGYFDWVYIDGNHQYEFAKKDIEMYAKKVRKGGFITGDDYCRGGWWKGGVKKAVDEAIREGRLKKIMLKSNQFVLQNV